MLSWPTMEATLGLPPIIKGLKPYQGRIARRVVMLFVLSALVPLSLCAVLLFRGFNDELSHAQTQRLDGTLRNFGMTLLGRLGSADDVFKMIIDQSGRSSEVARDHVAKLAWVSSVHRTDRSQLSKRGSSLPKPDPVEERALRAGGAILLTGRDSNGQPTIYLVRALPNGTWLYAQVDRGWLWTDAAEFSGEASLLLLDAQGQALGSIGAVPSELAETGALDAGRRVSTDPSEGKSGSWVSRSWELFLAGRYASPSLRLVAVRQRSTLLHDANNSSLYFYLCASIALTIVLIAWLSLVSIRRQLRPLALLTQATQHVSQRDFEAFRGMSWNDEFGELARSFDSMSQKLRRQFSALEAFAEVDRLLLGNPELQSILSTLLPRAVWLLGCDAVAVVLFDPESTRDARAYAYEQYAGQPAQRDPRIIVTGIAGLRSACNCPAVQVVRGTRQQPYFSASAPHPIATIRTFPLKNEGIGVGVLCLGYRGEVLDRPDSGVGAEEFADRLSLVLANLKQAENVRRQANYDSLTGLKNRHLFSHCVREAVAAARECNGTGAILYVDLDHFKRVNDTAGHASGDALLQVVAHRVTACVGEGPSVARLGGDEFAVLMPVVRTSDSARQLAERIIKALEPAIIVDDREHQVAASVGIALFPTHGVELDDLLKAADIAMYHAKDAGRAQAVFFKPEMQEKLLERVKLESDVRRACQAGVFTLHYQPILGGAEGHGVGVEALIRPPTTGELARVSPAELISVAEETGLIIELGEWVLSTACRQFAQWRREGMELEYISVNVSVRQLEDPEFLTRLLRALAVDGMRGEELQLEITESVLAQDAALRPVLEQIVALGVRLALDDFGTGYSSLGYLRTYPIHTLKIDRSFVLSLPQDVAGCRLVESIIVMCDALDKHVVAEGVETEAQRDFLLALGCAGLQGFLLGRPMEAAAVPRWLGQLPSEFKPSNSRKRPWQPSASSGHRLV
jgi:diguanylate cyclase (GGDEF)-like protein